MTDLRSASEGVGQQPTTAEYCRPNRTGHSVSGEQLQAGARSMNDRIPLACDHRPDPHAVSRPGVDGGGSTVNAPTLAKIMCQVQGNDHYDTDYAPCSECREMAEAILVKEAGQPEKLGLIGREAVLIENLAKSIHLSVRKGHEHTPLRETADRRGQWFDVRLADRRVARVTVVLDRIEEANDAI